MRRCATDRSSARSSRSLPSVVPLRAAQHLGQQLLRVFRLYAEALGDLHDAAAVEVAPAQDVLVARLQPFQRLARRELVGKAVEDARGGRVGTLEGLVVIERL